MTTIKKHSLAPWTLDLPHKKFSASAKSHIMCADDLVVSSIQYGASTQSISDGKLICAAPELLAALENMVRLFNHCGLLGLISNAKKSGWTQKHVDERLAAISKAKEIIKKAKGGK